MSVRVSVNVISSVFRAIIGLGRIYIAATGLTYMMQHHNLPFLINQIYFKPSTLLTGVECSTSYTDRHIALIYLGLPDNVCLFALQ